MTMKNDLKRVKNEHHRFNALWLTRIFKFKKSIKTRGLSDIVLLAFFEAIMLAQVLMLAFSSTTKISLFSWLITSVIFSVGMVLTYKALYWATIVKGFFLHNQKPHI